MFTPLREVSGLPGADCFSVRTDKSELVLTGWDAKEIEEWTEAVQLAIAELQPPPQRQGGVVPGMALRGRW